MAVLKRFSPTLGKWWNIKSQDCLQQNEEKKYKKMAKENKFPATILLNLPFFGYRIGIFVASLPQILS